MFLVALSDSDTPSAAAGVEPDFELDAFTYSDVDLEWHMHEVSDGERRRVQIVSGLMAPWDVLLLDEVRSSLRSPFRLLTR